MTACGTESFINGFFFSSQKLALGFDQRVIRRLERRPDDGEAGERLTGYIYSFPEGAGAQQNRSAAILESPD